MIMLLSHILLYYFLFLLLFCNSRTFIFFYLRKTDVLFFVAIKTFHILLYVFAFIKESPFSLGQWILIFMWHVNKISRTSSTYHRLSWVVLFKYRKKSEKIVVLGASRIMYHKKVYVCSYSFSRKS